MFYKAGDREKAKNYRPVSLTCQLSKVFEKLVRDELVDHLEFKGLLKGTQLLQHGFRKGRSCLTTCWYSWTGYREIGQWRQHGCDIFGFCKGL